MTGTNDSFAAVFGPETAPGAVLSSRQQTPSDSYFPSSHRTSFSSNTDSEAPITPDIGVHSRPTFLGQVGRAATTAVPSSETPSSVASTQQHKAVVVDAMLRTFPKPQQEATVEEMLTRPPQKWSLGHYVKFAREAKTPIEDKDERAKAFERAKKELLAAKAQLDGSR